MNGVDYTKNLAREREQYQTTIQKDRAQAEKRIAENEERHAKIQTKQREVFERDRRELESDYQTNLTDVKEDTNERIEEMRNRFHKASKAEQERFHQERATARNDYDGRMRDIKNSYDRAFRNERESNEAILETKENRYKNNVERITKDKDQKLGEFQDRIATSGAELRDQYKREKEQLVRAQEDRIKSVYKDEGQKRFDLKENLSKDLQRTQEAYQANTEQNQIYSKEKIDRLNSTFNERVSKMNDDYSKRNESFVEAQARDNAATNKQHESDMAELRRDYQRNLKNIDIEKRRRDNGSGEFAEIVRRQQGLKDDQVYEDKISRLNEQKAAEKREFNKHAAEMSDGHDQTLRTQSAEAAARLERKEKEMMADKIVAVSNEREKANKHSALQQTSQYLERQRYEDQINLERNDARKSMTKLKENFNRSLQDLQEKNEKFVKGLKEQTNEDKVKFITQQSIQRNDEVMELRRNFNKLMDTTVTDYETQLDKANRENSQLRAELDQKVNFLMADADRRVEQQTKMYEDKRQADARANQALMDHRENSFQNKIREVTHSYTKKMDQQTYDSEMKMKNTVNEYENKLKMKDAQYAKDMAEKTNLNNAELKRLKAALESEKAQIISMYENEMTELKRSFKQEQDKMNDYKKLS